jgi:hypothetical protein
VENEEMGRFCLQVYGYELRTLGDRPYRRITECATHCDKRFPGEHFSLEQSGPPATLIVIYGCISALIAIVKRTIHVIPIDLTFVHNRAIGDGLMLLKRFDDIACSMDNHASLDINGMFDVDDTSMHFDASDKGGSKVRLSILGMATDEDVFTGFNSDSI